MKTNKTDKRAAWLTAHKAEIEAARTELHLKPRALGRNAKGIIGMSGGGWGYWVWALAKAGIESQSRNYWAGSGTTPSTAINRGIADYIRVNAPEELRR